MNVIKMETPFLKRMDSLTRGDTMFNDIPWVDYLVLDEETLESSLLPDAPEDVRREYEKYINELQQYVLAGEKVPR